MTTTTEQRYDDREDIVLADLEWDEDSLSAIEDELDGIDDGDVTLADLGLELGVTDDDDRLDRTPGVRKALKALASARRKNLTKASKGQSVTVGGHRMKASTFIKKFGLGKRVKELKAKRRGKTDATEVRRYDLLGPLGLMNGARVDGDTGFLHAPVALTRSGVFLYRRPDGSVSRELKHPEDLFSPETIESAKRLVATVGHPKGKRGEPVDVSTDNASKLQVGQLGDSVRPSQEFGEDVVMMDLTITNAKVRDDIIGKGGAFPMNQVSPGFTAEIVEEAGEWNGERYDRRQTKIRYNHLAVAIPAGRGGHSVSIKLDEADAIQDAPEGAREERRSDQMPVKVKLYDAEIELEAGAASLVTDALRRKDEELKTAREDAATEKARADSEKKRADEAEEKAATDRARADKAEKDLGEEKTRADAAEEKAKSETEPVKDVLAVLDDAGSILGFDGMKPEERQAKRDELLDLEIPEGSTLVAEMRKATVLEKLTDEADEIRDEEPAYFRARFAQCLKDAGGEQRQDSTSAVGGKLVRDSSTARTGGDFKAEGQKRIDAVLSITDPLAFAPTGDVIGQPEKPEAQAS